MDNKPKKKKGPKPDPNSQRQIVIRTCEKNWQLIEALAKCGLKNRNIARVFSLNYQEFCSYLCARPDKRQVLEDSRGKRLFACLGKMIALADQGNWHALQFMIERLHSGALDKDEDAAAESDALPMIEICRIGRGPSE